MTSPTGSGMVTGWSGDPLPTGYDTYMLQTE